MSLTGSCSYTGRIAFYRSGVSTPVGYMRVIPNPYMISVTSNIASATPFTYAQAATAIYTCIYILWSVLS
jgi:hypothetical protein